MMKPKTIKCRSCGERGTPKNNSTLGYYCEKEACQNARIEKALKKVRKSTEAATKKANVEWNKERKQMMERLKSLADWKNDLQSDVNLIARLIDKGCPCIATGKYQGKMAGGHFIAVGANATIRFNLLNIHLQSFHSNSWKGGDNLRYRDGLVVMYGEDYLDEVEALKSTPAIHLNIDEIRQAISVAKKIIKELKAADETYTPGERIELRKKYNEQLGIYK